MAQWRMPRIWMCVASPHRTTKPSWGCDAQAELMRFTAFLAHKCPRLKVIPKKVNLDAGCDAPLSRVFGSLHSKKCDFFLAVYLCGFASNMREYKPPNLQHREARQRALPHTTPVPLRAMYCVHCVLVSAAVLLLLCCVVLGFLGFCVTHCHSWLSRVLTPNLSCDSNTTMRLLAP